MTIKVKHPSVEELTAFISGQLPESRAGDVERHIDDCEPCSQTLVGLSTEDTFIELLKEAGDAGDRSTIGMPLTASGTESDAATILSEHSRYEIVDLIARGGMGEVFKAKHRMMDRTVALKVIKKKLMQNAEVVERFHREVKTAAHLSHPNIVTAYDAEQSNGVHFLVMEYVEGTNLADMVKRDGPLEISQACDFVRQAATGLQHAHQQGMVHRDIKPHNLMLTKDGTVKILDFGLTALSPKTITDGHDNDQADASLTCVGRIMGTPDFISPEQAVDAHQADIRSDIYGLGATLYYLLTGKPPFSTGGVAERLKQHVETTPVAVNQVREDVPQDVADLVSRMLEKAPADRYQDPQEVESALNALTVAQPSPATVSRLPKKLMVLVGVLIVSLLAGLIYLETDKGTLAIETMDENVKVTISKVADSGSAEFTKLEVVDTVTGSSVSRLRSGAYKVSLEGESNEYQLDQDGFTLSRGENVVVTVTRAEPEKVEAPPLAEIPMPFMARQRLTSMGRSLSEAEAIELQTKVDNDPAEVASRLKLLGYYSDQSTLNAEARAPQLKLIRWFLDNYPQNAGESSMQIHASFDPEGYVEIKKKWLELLELYPSNTKIIDNAVKFVLLSDPELTEKLLKKAKQLEPEEPKWPRQLGHSYELRMTGERNKARREELGAKSLEQYELAISLTGDPNRLPGLRNSAAKTAMKGGLFQKAKTYAQGLLKSHGKKQDFNATHHANIILGRLALQSGDVETAKSHLLAAGQVSSTPVLMSFGPDMLLASKLLEKEEIEVVLEYFELCGKFWKKPKKLNLWADQAKKGVIPDFGPNLSR